MRKNEHTENVLDKYKNAASFIKPYILAQIVQTYNQQIKDKEPGRIIYKNNLKDIEPNAGYSPSLEIIIAYCIHTALSKENIDQAIKTAHENRRIYKRNWIKPIADELTGKTTPRNPRLLEKYATAAQLVNNLECPNKSDLTVENIMQRKYEELEIWRSDTTIPITQFFFLAKKPAKTIANGFINDVTYESLTIIRNMFDGSIDGFSIKYPTELSEYPIFNYRNSWIEFETEMLENELTLFNEYKFETEQENVHGDIKIQYKPEQKLPENVSKKSVSKMLKDLNIDLRQKELDMKDREIMTQLFNLLNGENLNDQYISCDLREFTKRIFNIKVPRKAHYEDISSRLQKLTDYNYTITLTNKETGDIVQTTTLGLLNYININYEDNTIQFTPSAQLVRTYVQKKYVNILSESYKTIDSAQTKGIMLILQQERLAEYSNNSSTKDFNLKYFRAHMKVPKMGNAALVKELKRHLSILEEKQIVVRNFEFLNQNSIVRINFMPLDEKELIAYNYTTKQIGESDFIDAEYHEIT